MAAAGGGGVALGTAGGGVALGAGGGGRALGAAGRSNSQTAPSHLRVAVELIFIVRAPSVADQLEVTFTFSGSMASIRTVPPPRGTPLPQSTRISCLVRAIGGVAVAVTDLLYAGVSPSYIGLYQVNLRVQAGVARGKQPIVITVGTLQSPTRPRRRWR